MGATSDSITGDTVFVGKGEFQIKEIYVFAEVRVVAGIIENVTFSSPRGDEIEEADAMVKRLVGQPLSRALEVNARDSDPGRDRHLESPSKVALLEAFHRAVEACFDIE